MSLDSKCCNYGILRTVLEMIDSMFCYIEDNIKALSWQGFSTLNFFSPSQQWLAIRMEIPADGLEALCYHKYVFEFQGNDEKINVHGLCKTMTGFAPTL